MAMARSSCGGVAIRYVLSVSCVTLYSAYLQWACDVDTVAASGVILRRRAHVNAPAASLVTSYMAS